MRKRAMRDGFQRGNRSADVDAGTDSADINNSGADISNSGADISNSGADISNICADVDHSGADNSTATDIGTGNVVYRNRTVDEQLSPRIQTPGGQFTHRSDRRLAQFRLKGVTHRPNPASRTQSRGFASHCNTNCSRIAGGSSCQ